MNVKIKKITKALLIIGVMWCLAGCNADSYLDGPITELYIRGDLNIEQADRLYKAGIMNKDEYNSLVGSITTSLNLLNVSEENAQTEAESTTSDGKTKDTTQKQVKAMLNSANLIGARRFMWGGKSISQATDITTTPEDGSGGFNNRHEDGEVTPFDIFSGDTGSASEGNSAIEHLNKKLQFSVYVLRKNPAVADKVDDYNSVVSLNEVSASCQAAKAKVDSGDYQIDETLSALFVDSGRTILDISNNDNLIIKPTEVVVDGDTLSYDEQSLWDEYNPSDEKNAPRSKCRCNNKLGEDLVLVHNKAHVYNKGKTNQYTTYTVDTMLSFQLNEFNPKAIDKIIGKEGLSSSTYLVSGTQAYLMEYPVWFIYGWKTEKDGDNYKFTPKYKMSDFVINLIDNKLYYKDGREVDQINKEFRYNVVGSGGDSSFVLDGVSRFKGENYTPAEGQAKVDVTSVTWKTEDGVTVCDYPTYSSDTGFYDKYFCNYGCIAFSDEAKKSKEQSIKAMAKTAEKTNKNNMLKFGSIVLRDYLEYTYAPDVVQGENAIALGRMFRVKTFTGTNGEVQVGEFIGKKGDESTVYNSVGIQAQDLVDVAELANNSKIKLDFGKTSYAIEETTEETTLDPDDPMGVRSIVNDNLEAIYKSSIHSTARFPGSYIDTAENSDISSENKTIKPILYGMALDLDAYTSNLISGWITVEGDGDSYGSLEWWNDWLSESGYTYHIDRDSLINSLQGNYNFDISNSNQIILNLNTLQSIQKIYDEDKESKAVGFIKSVFKVLGVVLILYGTLLIGAWIYDTNVVVGPRLLGFLTAGKWIAITDLSELPEVNMDGKAYMTISKVVVCVIIMIAIGVILNIIGITSIILLFIRLFSGIWEAISNAILG